MMQNAPRRTVSGGAFTSSGRVLTIRPRRHTLLQRQIMLTSSSLYGGQDPRELPAYSVSTAAYLLNLPATTLQKWVSGRPSRASSQDAPAVSPLIVRPGHSSALSFFNLLECHALSSLRRRHNISVPNIRRALNTLADFYPDSPHPLLNQEFQTDGISLFMERLDALVNISRGGQIAMRELIEVHLQRIEHDSRGLPVKLFPFIRNPNASFEVLKSEPRSIQIDAGLSFGRPVLAGTGIPTLSIAERFKAGEEAESIADDYGCEVGQIVQAVRYELRLREAA